MIHGVIPPTVTLFTSDGVLDSDGNAAHCDFLIEQGVHGLFVLGTTGEFMHLATREREQHATEIVQHVNGRVPVIVGTGTTSTTETVRLSRHAQGVGASAVAVITPYAWTLNDREVIAHLSAVANAVDIPVIVYNFPSLSGCNVATDTLAALVKEHSNIAGIKDSVDSAELIRQRVTIVKAIRPEFSVLTGDDGLLLTTLELGGDGSIPATANLVPGIHVGVYKSFRAGDYRAAIDAMRELGGMLDLYRIQGSFHSVIKEAMGLLGLSENTTARLPALPLTAESRARVRSILERAGLTQSDDGEEES